MIRKLLVVAATAATVLISAAVLAETSAARDIETVKIMNVYTHSPVDIMPGGLNASTQPYAGAFLWKNSISDSQWFDLIYATSGDTKAFMIRNHRSGLCLMLDFRAPYTNGTRVIQYSCDAKNYRSRWWKRYYYTTEFGRVYEIHNYFTDKCLDVDNPAGNSPRTGSVLQQWTCISWLDDWNADNQLWRFQY
jgi:Ricin-type beta-trefoil lectin domain-like